MITDAKGQNWCMVLVQRQDGTEFLDIVPGAEDLAVLGVFAWAAFPNAKRIDTRTKDDVVHVLVNPVREEQQ